MATLEEYLASAYFSNKQDMESISRSLEEVARTFAKTKCDNGWAYEFRCDETPLNPEKPSQGTLAMILTATGRMLGKCRFSGQQLVCAFDKALTEKLTGAFDTGLKLLVDDLHDGRIRSSTFGDFNPITLSHVAELVSSLADEKHNKARDALLEKLVDAEEDLRKRIGLRPGSALLTKLKNGNEYHLNAFVPLRAIRALVSLKQAGISTLPSLTDYRGFFESMLHDQLSYSSIPDSRFDPAELAFCLEGLLLCAPQAVDRSLFLRVLDVLDAKQNTSAHWRPNKPFLASNTGAIVLPVSVEAANSLMRSVAALDQRLVHDTLTAKSLPLLRRFWSWLQARGVRFDDHGAQCLGWHSEHINQPDLIHPWDTSQVVEFMLAYRELVEREIETRTLSLSGLDWSDPKPVDPNKTATAWEEQRTKLEPSINAATKASPSKTSAAATAVAGGEGKANAYAPKPDGSSEDTDKSAANPDTAMNQVYYRIGVDFYDGWKSKQPKNFSMLLYGPPGTGKTSVAKALSEALGLRRVTVTVSDFLGAGGANVEARAKAIFQTLLYQKDCVILFDEIDSFLLDRDSHRYRDQDSLFQFLTPGMLTKIADLRNEKRSIFIVATNYQNRIDPAIKRTGRIDKRYLLPLPNALRRQLAMEANGLPAGLFGDEMRAETVFFGFTDLKNAAQDIGRIVDATSGKGVDADAALAIVRQATPATTLVSYLNRLKDDPADFPEEEFDDLVRLAIEARAAVPLCGAVKFLKKEITSLAGAEEATGSRALDLVRILASLDEKVAKANISCPT